MYRDVAQWLDIRHRILVQGSSIRRVASEKGIDPRTIRKMLDHALPQTYGPRSHRYPKLGPHTASIRRLLRENATLPPTARLSIKGIYVGIFKNDQTRYFVGPQEHDAIVSGLEKNKIVCETTDIAYRMIIIRFKV